MNVPGTCHQSLQFPVFAQIPKIQTGVYYAFRSPPPPPFLGYNFLLIKDVQGWFKNR